ncbi:hypothetical protein D3C76_1105830 [compost metagenome]
MPLPGHVNLPAHLIPLIGKGAKEAIVINGEGIFFTLHRVQFAFVHFQHTSGKVAVIRGNFSQRLFYRDAGSFTAFQQAIVGCKGQRILTRRGEPCSGVRFRRIAEMYVRIFPALPANFYLAVRQVVVRPCRLQPHAFIQCGRQGIFEGDHRSLVLLRVFHTDHVGRRGGSTLVFSSDAVVVGFPQLQTAVIIAEQIHGCRVPLIYSV